MSERVAEPEESRAWDDQGLASRFVLLWAVIYKRFLLLVRYPVNTAALLANSFLFFAILFFGGQAAVSQVQGGVGALGSTLDALIVGWFLWTMSLTAYFSLSTDVTNESEWGTLEQLYMSPYGFGSVMGAKVITNVLWSLLMGSIMLAFMLVVTDRTLAVDVVTIAPISILAIASVVGIGFVFAGLTLIYKRIENVSQLMQFVIIGLIAAPVTGYSPLRFLPLVQGSAMLQRAMTKGVSIWQFSALDLGMLVGAAIVYLAAGYAVFAMCTRRARQKGLMGHY